VVELIGTLDVEERTRAKNKGKGVETSSANMVQKKNSFAFRKNKKKNQNNKQENTSKLVQTTQFKKKNNNKKKGGCFVCGSEEHWASECLDRKFKQELKKSVNMVTTDTEGGAYGYGNYLPTILLACNSPEWWMDSGANIHVCADVSLFASYQVGRTRALLMENGSRVHILGAGTVNLKFTSGKTVLLKNVQHVPSIKKNLVSGSMMCRDGYKIILESNKCVVFRHGTFIGK
jgi:hypothetical protein